MLLGHRTEDQQVSRDISPGNSAQAVTTVGEWGVRYASPRAAVTHSTQQVSETRRNVSYPGSGGDSGTPVWRQLRAPPGALGEHPFRAFLLVSAVASIPGVPGSQRHPAWSSHRPLSPCASSGHLPSACVRRCLSSPLLTRTPGILDEDAASVHAS